ncbi:hypothetical protein LCL87_25075 [Rhodococcus hoagii]|nr:hypothetical protein [Prescottella equi]
MTDLLAHWWRWPVMVERHAGDGTDGPVFEAAEMMRMRITAKRKKALSADGTEVISEARASGPANTRIIPVGSMVTLPPEWGSRRAEVLAEQLHHDGAGLTPNFYSIDLT